MMCVVLCVLYLGQMGLNVLGKCQPVDVKG